MANESLYLCPKQTKPRLMFISLVNFLREKKIEIPGYHTFAEVITDTFRSFEKILISSMDKNLSIGEKQLLDGLLEFGDEYQDGDKQDAKLKRYKITLLKKSNQSTQPSKIKEYIQDLKSLESLFVEIEHIINKLKLSPELIQYYAQVVIKSRVFQISRREKRRYLLLIAFVAYQYFRLNDVLIEVLMQSVQNKFNTIEREHRENFYNQRKERQQILNTFFQKVTAHLNAIEDAKTILSNQTLSADEKVSNLMSIFSDDFNKSSAAIEIQLNQIGQESKRITKNADYYDLLEANSIKLQNRASEIVKNLQFNQATSNCQIIQAIEYYSPKDGNIANNVPTDFLEAEEQELVFDDSGRLKISLYKVLLFSKIADEVRSEALNLKYSYKYRAFDDYLISPKVWEANKKELLEKAGLLEMQEFPKLEAQLKKTLQDQFRITNENINQHELENTINWYFTNDNIVRVNDKILGFMDQFKLLQVFKQNQDITHTSSDGQKFSIGVESLNANYSFKYFGKGKGVSVYSFIDESHRLFYSTVINPSEREAAYVIDGLMHNDVVQSDIHSTDTHGYSEMIFATTHLLGISFAPRIKSFKDQQLYSFESPSSLKAHGYNILPKKRINTKIIKEQWDYTMRVNLLLKNLQQSPKE